MPKRVQFTFDERSLEPLNRLIAQRGRVRNCFPHTDHIGGEMYPSWGNCHSTQHAIVTLPDGRTVRAKEEGYHEGDTNAWVETSDMELYWEGGDNDGDELTDEEINQVFEIEGVKYNVVEYVCHFGQWKAE